ncbi:uncharacterized protein ARB_07110 [Trichophyton benhamiae CBS 112371]|uniref:Protein YOP1 n=1 Tax=Arthroderma benhamiae (strain ATCC MYA-4681 / CBS 112371) TaxID=663331 RepID=D4AS95_ARTBC|nr:uncharacterized protein ARB_07110 [Trichophyton benhamiae CBS 112371]EFE34159.1 hypothetical protein ARB_07110 [Trichophyton benhamiae CBS 112371]
MITQKTPKGKGKEKGKRKSFELPGRTTQQQEPTTTSRLSTLLLAPTAPSHTVFVFNTTVSPTQAHTYKLATSKMSFQDRVQHQIAQIDKELSRYPVLNNLERQTSVPKVYAFLGVAGIYVFLVFFNIAGAFLVNLAGFAIPGYYSLNALFTSSTADDTQVGSAMLRLFSFALPTLTFVICARANVLFYWVVFALFSVVESAISASYWFPFYYLFKFFLVLWMALPQTSGAQIVFHSFIQPVFARYFQGPSTSSNLRAQAEQAAKEHSS